MTKTISDNEIENLVGEGDFETIASMLFEEGNEKLAKIAVSLSHSLPYISGDQEKELCLEFIKAYKNRVISSPVAKTRFSSLTDAMKHFKITSNFSAKDEIVQQEKDRAKEKRLYDKERKLLTPSIVFRPIFAKRIGLTESDVIIIGESPNIQKALLEFDYKCDFLSINQVIIRKVTLLGLRKDSFYVPGVRNKKQKIKYNDWRGKIREKRKAKKFFISEITKVVDRIKLLKDKKIVIAQTCAYKDYYYFLLLPRTVVSKPYCRERMGKLIPIIHQWGILGV